MNKIKFLNDIVKTMQEKESLKGTIEITGNFEKSKINITHEFDSSEMNHINGACQGRGHKGMMRKMRMMHGRTDGGSYNQSENELCETEKTNGMGIKKKLAMVSAGLEILNNIKIDDTDDGKFVVSFDSHELSEDIKQTLHSNLHAHHMNHHGFDTVQFEGKEQFKKHFRDMGEHQIKINMLVNAAKEVEKITFTATAEENGSNKAKNMNVVITPD